MGKPILKGYYGPIFFEFLVHERPADVIIILPGFPSSNNMDEEMKFLHEKGYHVFFPRYKGSYQSKGKFLARSPVDGLIDFVKNLQNSKAISLWDMKEIQFKLKRLILLGGSFSGVISCGLSVKYPIFSHLVLIDPVLDFSKVNQEGNEEDPVNITQFVKRAYYHLYRYDFDDIAKAIGKYKELSPDYYSSKLKIPILVFHDPDDHVVSINHTIRLSKNIKNLKLIKHSLGHSFDIKLLQAYWEEISSFLNKN